MRGDILMLRQIRLLTLLIILFNLFSLPLTSSTPAIAAEATLAPLPRKCGSGLPPGTANTVCCMFGYVFADGQPVPNAKVTITNQRTNGSVTIASSFGPDSDAPYYSVSLSDSPLNASLGDQLVVDVHYSDHFVRLYHSVLLGGQQVDAVLPKDGDPDYIFERQLREQMAPGQFGYIDGDVAIDGAGLVYVADYGNARIQVFTADGKFVRQWGMLGSAPGQLVTPMGITLDRLGYVYVADFGGQHIQKYTATGTWIATWGTFDNTVNTFAFPMDLTTDADGFIYFVERGADYSPPRIQKRTSDGGVVKVWGSQGATAGTFAAPEGIALGPDGLLYVADTGNSRVQVFTREGEFVRQWNGGGTAGQLNKPKRIAVASDGRVVVSDSGNNRIAIFSAMGTFIEAWGSLGSGDNQLRTPTGIALDGIGRVFVSDAGNTRIQVFSSTGVPINRWGSLGYPDNVVNGPIGMTRDNAGNLYIVDSYKSVVRKYGANGIHIADFGGFDNGSASLLFPSGIATNGTSELYILDKDNNRIQVFSTTGVPLRTWGSPGSGNGQFKRAYGIAADSAGNVYVADSGNNRVQKFTADGTFRWSQPGSGATQFKDPEGLTLSADGNTVYVIDTENNRVQVLRASDGAILRQFGSAGGQFGQFRSPSDIAMAADGTLLIADTDNYRIQRFAIDGTPLNYYGGDNGAGPGEYIQPTNVLPGADGRIIVAELNLGRVQFLRPMTFTRPIATIVAAEPLVTQAGSTVTLYGIGGVSESSRNIAAYIWTLDGTTIATSPDATLSTSGLSPGTHTIGFYVRDSAGQASDLQSVTLNIVGEDTTTGAGPQSWTFMLYLAADNTGTASYLDANSQLGALHRLLNATPNTRVNVAALFDADVPGGGDTVRYLLRPNMPPIIEPQPETNMGDPQTLIDFVQWAQTQAPADATYLAIADHGNALDGTSWDFTSSPDKNERLTPPELLVALAQITDGGARPIDVLHLDSCLMGLVETAYQLRGQARYLVASESLAWSAFAYDQYLGLVSAGTTPKQLATSIVDRYAKLVGEQELPYTIAAIDLAQIPSLTDALNSVASELLRYAQAGQANLTTLASVRQQTQLLDSSGDGKLAADDEYIDLNDWLTNTLAIIPDTQVQQAATAARTALKAAIIAEHHASGTIKGTFVNLDNASGLGIYYPPAPGARTYQTYRINMSFAEATLWDELLQAGLAALQPTEDAGPNPVAPLPFALRTGIQIFLPIVQK